MTKRQGAKLESYFVMKITPDLRRIQDEVYREVLGFAKFMTGNSDLESIEAVPTFEMLCDAYFLVRTGAVKCLYTDYLPDYEGESIMLKMTN